MDEPRNRGMLILGALLVAAGLLFLAAEIFGAAGAGVWPFIVIAIGALFFVGMVAAGRQAGALAVPGGIIVAVGVIALLQNMLGWWEMPLFSWALVIAGVGLGLLVYGFWSNRPDLRDRGWRTLATGLTLFLVFGSIVELVLSTLGVVNRASRLVWPLLLVAVGLLQFAFRTLQVVRRPAESRERDIDLFGPLFLVGIGGLAYLVLSGQVAAARVLALGNLWPVLLIALGVMLLLRGRFPLGGALVGVAVVAVMFGAVLAGDRLGLPQTPWWFGADGTWGGTRGLQEVRGSGNVISESRTVAGFEAVTVELAANIEITPGASESLAIEADDNLLPYLVHEVRGRELVIRAKPGAALIPSRTIQLRLGVPVLTGMTMSGAGDITIHRLETDRLRLSSSGWGTFRVEEVTAGSLDVALSGGGTVTAAGKVDRLNVQISGAGSYDGPDLRARTVNVQISGFGQATVWAAETLVSDVSGFGRVAYYGSPRITQTNSGLGDVAKLGDK